MTCTIKDSSVVQTGTFPHVMCFVGFSGVLTLNSSFSQLFALTGSQPDQPTGQGQRRSDHPTEQPAPVTHHRRHRSPWRRPLTLERRVRDAAAHVDAGRARRSLADTAQSEWVSDTCGFIRHRVFAKVTWSI